MDQNWVRWPSGHPASQLVRIISLKVQYHEWGTKFKSSSSSSSWISYPWIVGPGSIIMQTDRQTDRHICRWSAVIHSSLVKLSVYIVNNNPSKQAIIWVVLQDHTHRSFSIPSRSSHLHCNPGTVSAAKTAVKTVPNIVVYFSKINRPLSKPITKIITKSTHNWFHFIHPSTSIKFNTVQSNSVKSNPIQFHLLSIDPNKRPSSKLISIFKFRIRISRPKTSWWLRCTRCYVPSLSPFKASAHVV